jgi:predicted MFS family arabinose efflux permease
MACILGMICCAFIDPTLSVRLGAMGMGETGIGFEFASMGISWGFGSTIGGWLCEKTNRRVIMQVAFFFLFGSCLLSGPSALLGLPDKVWILTVGIIMNWFFGSWLVVPVASEVIDATGEAKCH